MINTIKAVRKYQSDKKEIINNLIAMIYAVRGANTPGALSENLDKKFYKTRTRAEKLAAKLSLTVIDYLYDL